MTRRKYFIAILLSLTFGLPATAQELQQVKKFPAGCVGSKEKSTAAASAEFDETEYVPVRTTVGDMNSDGRAEKIVLVRYIGKSGLRADEIMIFEALGGGKRLLARRAVGGPGEYALSVKSFGSNFKVVDGLLFVDVAVRAGMGKGFPAHFRTVTYGWDSSSLAEVSRSEPKPLLEHMREKG